MDPRFLRLQANLHDFWVASRVYTARHSAKTRLVEHMDVSHCSVPKELSKNRQDICISITASASHIVQLTSGGE